MNDLIQAIKDVLKRPRLVIQYCILNFFLLSVGLAAVVYIQKEALENYQQYQNQLILHVSKDLNKVDLPARTEDDVRKLQLNAEVKVGDQSVKTDSKK